MLAYTYIIMQCKYKLLYLARNLASLFKSNWDISKLLFCLNQQGSHKWSALIYQFMHGVVELEFRISIVHVYRKICKNVYDKRVK